jgi:metal-dependent amidase/aminoacylase/carboxypeptidase family protein
MDKLKERLGLEVESPADELFAVSVFLLENPEIAYDEFKACDHLGHVLEQKGFQVENGVGNVDT